MTDKSINKRLSNAMQTIRLSERQCAFMFEPHALGLGNEVTLDRMGREGLSAALTWSGIT